MTNQVKQERIQNRILPEVQEFRDSRKTLQLATISKDGLPHASYSPFAFSSEGYFILVSDVAQHGQNLKHNKAISILMIENEDDARKLFKRRRLSFDATAQHIERESEKWHHGVQLLRERLGEIIDDLAQLGDFNLYLIAPEKGRYVKGFGQAFDVSGDDMVSIVHLTEGHVKAMREGEE